MLTFRLTYLGIYLTCDSHVDKVIDISVGAVRGGCIDERVMRSELQ